MASSSGGFGYTPLAEAKTIIKKKINICAIIIEIHVPLKSSGTDYYMTLKLADQTYSAPGISVTIFARDVAKLPRVKSYGDIICLHQVMMKDHAGEIYCAYDKSFSSFAIFEGEGAANVICYETSLNYHVIHHDNEPLLQLRKYFLDHQFTAVLLPRQSQVKGIKSGEDFDLVCQVLHVEEYNDREWLIFVWDGTDTPPGSLKTKLNLEKEDPLPLHIEALPLATEVLSAFPPMGSVLRIIVPKFFIEISPGENHWVKLCGITCHLQSGLWIGRVHSYSKIRFLSEGDGNVKLDIRDYEKRWECKEQSQFWTIFPSASRITEIEGEPPFTTLIESFSRLEVPHICRTIVRVVDVYPWKANRFRSSKDGHYRIRLTLEDSTARIHAFIHGNDGVKFFKGYHSHDILWNNMKKLLGIDESIDGAERTNALRNPPRVRCCLVCYYRRGDPARTRTYRIVNTVFVG